MASNKKKPTVFIIIILKLLGVGAKSFPVPHPTFNIGIFMNARKILNPNLRQAVAGMSVKQIRALHLKLELDVSQLRIFLRLIDDRKPQTRRPSPIFFRGQLPPLN